MGNFSRESLFCSLLAFLCLGLTSAGYAFDDPPSPAGQPGTSVSPGVLTGEIAGQVEYWPAHCGELEAARRNLEASRCWWYAAEELNRYVNGRQPVTDELRELRRDWLWRGVRLSRQLLEPKRTTAVEPPAVPPAGVDPAPAAAAVSCASISSDDGTECLGVSASGSCAAVAAPAVAAPAVAAPAVKPTQSPKKAAAIPKVSKKKTVQAEIAKEKTAPVKKAGKKTIAKPVAVRTAQAALPLIPEKKTNIACPPSRPCVGRRLPGSPPVTKPERSHSR